MFLWERNLEFRLPEFQMLIKHEVVDFLKPLNVHEPKIGEDNVPEIQEPLIVPKLYHEGRRKYSINKMYQLL